MSPRADRGSGGLDAVAEIGSILAPTEGSIAIGLVLLFGASSTSSLGADVFEDSWECRLISTEKRGQYQHQPKGPGGRCYDAVKDRGPWPLQQGHPGSNGGAGDRQ